MTAALRLYDQLRGNENITLQIEKSFALGGGEQGNWKQELNERFAAMVKSIKCSETGVAAFSMKKFTNGDRSPLDRALDNITSLNEPSKGLAVLMANEYTSFKDFAADLQKISDLSKKEMQAVGRLYFNPQAAPATGDLLVFQQLCLDGRIQSAKNHQRLMIAFHSINNAIDNKDNKILKEEISKNFGQHGIHGGLWEEFALLNQKINGWIPKPSYTEEKPIKDTENNVEIQIQLQDHKDYSSSQKIKEKIYKSFNELNNKFLEKILRSSVKRVFLSARKVFSNPWSSSFQKA